MYKIKERRIEIDLVDDDDDDERLDAGNTLSLSSHLRKS